MSVIAYRFRNEGALVVLQVSVKNENPGSGYYDIAPRWRDAATEDLLDVARLMAPGPQVWRTLSSVTPDQQ